MIAPDRIRILSRLAVPVKSRDYVLYWMQASQRAEGNHALEFAVDRANESGKPLVCFFGLTPDFPGANLRHYAFMLDGLAETRRALALRGIPLAVRMGPPGRGAAELGRRAAIVVVDRGHLRIERAWRTEALRFLDVPLVEIESNLIVPVETASPKEEFTAATFRPRLKRRLKDFLIPVVKRRLKKRMADLASFDIETLDPGNVEAILHSLPIERSAGIVSSCRGGRAAALKRLARFLDKGLDDYAEARNDPSVDGTSGLSAYLHFGQISPLEIALSLEGRHGPGTEAFLEELVVRRELAFNFVHYNPRYDEYDGLPEWSRTSLAKHAEVPRDAVYDAGALEAAGTHDPFWNAAQNEMRLTGKMHGYMRMYWGKKILEWSDSPEEAFRIAIRLNDKYELDGRDPNGFAGVAWCFGKHDRPWPERPIFGKVRYMNEAGLRRKFDMDGYLARVAALRP